MRLTTRSNLAMRTLMYCAVNAHQMVRKHEIAAACNASENHLGQVIHRLSQLGYLRTQRGRAGGVMLGRPMEEIRVGEVLRQFETRLPFAECFSDSENTCPLVAGCRLRPALAAAFDAFFDALVPVTLGDLVAGNDCLEHIMRLPEGMGRRLPQMPACRPVPVPA